MKRSLIMLLLFISGTLLHAQEKEEPKSPGDEHFSDGLVNLILQKFPEAEADFTKAIEKDPKYADAYNYRGKVKGAQKKYDEGIKDVNKALELDPGNALYYYNRATIYNAKGDHVKAETDFTKAIGIDVTLQEAYSGRGTARFKMEKYEDAVKDYTLAIALSKDDKQAYYMRGKAYLLLGKNDEGCSDLRMARSLGKTDANELIAKYCKEDPSDQKEDYATKIANAPMLDNTNAKTIKSYENTPESVVTYFYASKIRGDDKWKEVMIPESEWDERVKYKVEKYSKWTITKFQLREKKKSGETSYYIKIYMEIEVDGKKDGGEDTVTVKMINGKWTIISIPT